MVRLRSQRQVHFLRVFPLSSLLLQSFSSFLSSLVAPIWASPRIIRYFPSESTPGSKSKMRKGEGRKVKRSFRFFLIKLPRGPSSLFSFSFLIIGPRYTLVHLRCRTLRSLPSFIFRHRAISVHRENQCGLTGKIVRFACGLVSISAFLLSLYRVLLKFIGLPDIVFYVLCISFYLFIA